jgi:hypothetical protein
MHKVYVVYVKRSNLRGIHAQLTYAHLNLFVIVPAALSLRYWSIEALTASGSIRKLVNRSFDDCLRINPDGALPGPVMICKYKAVLQTGGLE